MNQKLYDILKLLSTESYQSAQEIAKKLGLSEKTVRTRIKELRMLLAEYGAEVEAKQHFGYRLLVHDAQAFLQVSPSKEGDTLPESTEERQRFLLKYLLDHEMYVKLDDLSEQLYISRNTLSGNIKRVEDIARVYNLSIERRPNHGIRLIGSELDKRICIVSNLFESVQDETAHQWLINLILSGNQSHNVKMTEIALDSFAKYILVMVARIKAGHEILQETPTTDISQATQRIIEEYAQAIEEYFQVSINTDERYYLAIQYSSKLSSDSYSQYGPNFIITGKIDELVFKMLMTVYETFALDFRNNLELRMSLNQHLVPMDIRMRYHIPIENPLLEQIKQEYAYPYTLALTACLSLQDYYHCEIPEEEIAYIAIIFALATEKRDRTIERKNIVLVCVSGKSSSQLFKYKYKQAFGQYINEIHECTVAELDSFDFKGNAIDYIFTTVPLVKKYPVPIYEINLFIDANDILVYREMFENSSSSHILDYFSTNLFVPKLIAENREEVILQMCQLLDHYGLVPEHFYEAVLKREELGQTDFGNLVAIPHPYKVLTKDSFVTVAILDKPILWNKNKVQVIFLLSVGSKEDSNLEEFYQRVVNLVFDETAIKRLIEKPTFETLINILT